MRRRRSGPLRGRNPSTQKRSAGRPLTTSAPTTEEGPGTVLTVSPAAASWAASQAPGSEMPGVPASLTTATVAPPATAPATRSRRAASLCPCSDRRRSPLGPLAVMPLAESRARVRRVSSQQIRSAVASTSRARGERSPRFPIGVATSTSRPRRSSLTACRLRHRSGPRAPRAGRRPARPSARAIRPRSATAPRAARPPMATRHGLSRATRTTVRSVERKATSMGNFMPAVCTVRAPSTCSAPSQPRPPPERAALGRRVGHLERTHHIAVPQQPSGPHLTEATGPPAASRLSSAPHVEANGQAQAQDEEEGQPRQEAELRPRLTLH